jgi:hypothetical protein
MAEIKSTLDLVLEKTKHLTLTAEEKAEMQLQDFFKKVPGYVTQILDLSLMPEQLLEKTKALPQELRGRSRKEITRQLSLAVDLSAATDPLIAALELLVESDLLDLLAEVISCRSRYSQARDDAWQQAQDSILGGLAAAGIRGSAVVAKLEGESSWEAEDSELRQPCLEQLEAFRAALGR